MEHHPMMLYIHGGRSGQGVEEDADKFVGGVVLTLIDVERQY